MMKHVVICGGGFAGVRLARKLKRQKDINVTVINDSSYFRYYPAMYRAATGFKLASARLPLEWMMLDIPRTALFIDTVTGIDTKTKHILTEGGEKISYDIAVFALGSVTTYFNIEGVHEHAYGMKSPAEIKKLRSYLHEQVTGNSEADHNYVIVGAGPTGVELAGSLGAHIKHIVKKHHVKRHPVKIWLVEADSRILPQLSVKTARAARKRLKNHGVKVLINTAVKRETINELNTSHGPIKTHTVIWTAGTANNPFFAAHPEVFELNERGRVVVDDHLMTRDDIYVIGDNAATPHSGLAATAIIHATFTAHDIVARLHNKRRPSKFERQPISVVPVDSTWAVLQYKRLVIHGWTMAMVRRAADYIGYSDVLGFLKAFSIWSSSEKTENACPICDKNS